MARKKTKFLLISAERRDISIHETKMHSSRMRTAHSLPYKGEGGGPLSSGGGGSVWGRGLCPGGFCLGVSVRGGVSLTETPQKEYRTRQTRSDIIQRPPPPWTQ